MIHYQLLEHTDAGPCAVAVEVDGAPGTCGAPATTAAHCDPDQWTEGDPRRWNTIWPLCPTHLVNVDDHVELLVNPCGVWFPDDD